MTDCKRSHSFVQVDSQKFLQTLQTALALAESEHAAAIKPINEKREREREEYARRVRRSWWPTLYVMLTDGQPRYERTSGWDLYSPYGMERARHDIKLDTKRALIEPLIVACKSHGTVNVQVEAFALVEEWAKGGALPLQTPSEGPDKEGR